MTYKRSLRHDQAQRFSIRKSAFGAASVLLGTVFLLGTEATVRADEPVLAAEAVQPVYAAAQAANTAEAAVAEEASGVATVADQPTTVDTNAVKEYTPVAETETSEELVPQAAEPKTEEAYAESSEEVSEEASEETTEPTVPVTVDEGTSQEVTLAYRNELAAKREQLLTELAALDAQIAEAEALLAEDEAYGEVLSKILTAYKEQLDETQARIKELDGEIEDLNNQLKDTETKISDKQDELDNLKANNPQAQLLDDIKTIEKLIKDKEKRIEEIDAELEELRKKQTTLADESSLNKAISDKKKELDDAKEDLNKLEKDIQEKKKERDNHENKAQGKIDKLQDELNQLPNPETTIVHGEKELEDIVTLEIKKHSQTTWEEKVRDSATNVYKQELVRFTGERDYKIAITEEQAAAIESGSYTYVPNVDEVEKYFFEFVKEIRQNNGISIPTELSETAKTFAREWAQKMAEVNNNMGAISHSDINAYENVGMAVPLLKSIRTDQELAYYIAFQWFSDYNNKSKSDAFRGGYGHRNALLLGTHYLKQKNSEIISSIGLDEGNGLGLHQASEDYVDKYGRNYGAKAWYYSQNGNITETSTVIPSQIQIIRDTTNNQSVSINGVKKATVFMDALNFKYVVGGYTEVKVDQGLANRKEKLQNTIKSKTEALKNDLKAYDEAIEKLQDQEPGLIAKRDELQKKVDELHATKNNLPAERQKVADAIKTLEDEKADLEKDIEDLNELLKQKQDALKEDETTKRIQDLTQEIKDLQVKKQDIKSQLQKKEEERRELLKLESELTHEITEIEKQIEEQKREEENFKRLLEISRRKRNKVQHNIETIDDIVDNLDNYVERNPLLDPEVFSEEDSRVTLKDVNGTGVTINLSTAEGVVKVVVVKHIEPTLATPNPVERLAGQDFDLYDIKLVDENGNYVTNLKYTAIVKLPVDAGKVVERVIYLPEEGEAEDLEILEQTDGYVYFQAEHFSFYGIVYRKVTVPNYTPKTPTGTEKTTEEPTKEIDSGAGQSAGTTVQTGVAPAATTATSTETSSAVATEKTLPNTGDVHSLLGLLGAGLTAAGLVGRRKRR